jgi:hypothetical protein
MGGLTERSLVFGKDRLKREQRQPLCDFTKKVETEVSTFFVAHWFGFRS